MYQYKYPHPAVTADCVVFGHDGDEMNVLLIERKHDPCKGCWAFPGGFMDIHETAEAAAIRELEEETGLKVGMVHQVGAFTTVDRDPRERVITIAFYAEVEGLPTVRSGDDAKQARWFRLSALPSLAFDHAEILSKAVLSKIIDERLQLKDGLTPSSNPNGTSPDLSSSIFHLSSKKNGF